MMVEHLAIAQSIGIVSLAPTVCLLFDISLPLSLVRNHSRFCSEGGDQVSGLLVCDVLSLLPVLSAGLLILPARLTGSEPAGPQVVRYPAFRRTTWAVALL
jgi:hypothetical protein